MRLPDERFWRGRRVLLTGHTGFKGSWLAHWLLRLGAEVHGYALAPQTQPSAFEALELAQRLGARSRTGDVCDRAAVAEAVAAARPEIVLHLAAQPLVLTGYREPVETFGVNVMGTVNVLDAVRASDCVRAVVVVTTDKVYAENEHGRPYAESDPLGGVEPYGGSKACAEIVAQTYRAAYLRARGTGVATARAGNVIGGGDRSPDRLIPDLVAALESDCALALRNPGATRPWQHVLDPLAGYLILAERLAAGDDAAATAWNFGPGADSFAAVGDVVARFERAWGAPAPHAAAPDGPREAPRLLLDAFAARADLGWSPRFDLAEAIALTAQWYLGVRNGLSPLALTDDQLDRYTASAAAAPA